MALRPAAVLATLGVVGTAGLMGVAARLSGFAWPQALLHGAVVSSTDAIPLLWPFGYRWPERAYIGWVGLRGAVPVILVIFPVLARAPGAERIFDAVFFIVLVNTVVQGFTVRRGARRLGLESHRPPPPQGLLEISATRALASEILVFYVDAASAVAGSPIVDLPAFPAGSSVLLVFRGDELIPARGQTVLQPGDHVYVLCRAEDRSFVHLLFGEAQES
jgi:cell volume regulation protein A